MGPFQVGYFVGSLSSTSINRVPSKAFRDHVERVLTVLPRS